MKLALAAAALTVVTCLLAATRSVATPTPPASPLASALVGANHHAAAVRAEYTTFNGRIAGTICHLTNTSVTETVVLKQVVVLGANGASSILAIHNGLFGVALPPLASVALPIDNGIAGVAPQTTATGGVRQAVFVWDGAQEAVHLTAAIESRWQSNEYTRAEVVERGVALQP